MKPRLAAGALLLSGAATAAAPPAADEAALRAHAREWASLEGAVPAVLVIELREIVERAAGRGGASVGSLSQRRRLEAFEGELLARSHGAACPSVRQPLPPPLLAAVRETAAAQQLPLSDADAVALSARLQRLVEALPPARWCALRTLEPVR